MLAIRLQRRGRRGLAQFRVIVQEASLSPKSEKVVASLGSYDPHTKEASIDKEQAEFYLSNGAQPSNRVIKLFMDEKITLPKWAELETGLEGKIKNPDKLRKNAPKEEPAAEAEAEKESSEEESPSVDEAKESEESEAEAKDDKKESAEETSDEEKKSEG